MPLFWLLIKDMEFSVLLIFMNHNCVLQEKALEALDKEVSPAESNDSDSEEAQVDRDSAMKEKEKVKLLCEGWIVIQCISKPCSQN